MSEQKTPIKTLVLREQAVLAMLGGMGRSTWRAGIAAGKFPKPLKFSPRCVGWLASDIEQLVARLASESAEA